MACGRDRIGIMFVKKWGQLGQFCNKLSYVKPFDIMGNHRGNIFVKTVFCFKDVSTV